MLSGKGTGHELLLEKETGSTGSVTNSPVSFYRKARRELKLRLHPRPGGERC